MSANTLDNDLNTIAYALQYAILWLEAHEQEGDATAGDLALRLVRFLERNDDLMWRRMQENPLTRPIHSVFRTAADPANPATSTSTTEE